MEVLVAVAVFALMGAFLFGFAVRLSDEAGRLEGLRERTAQLRAFWDGLRRDLQGRLRVSFSGLAGGMRGEEDELSLVLPGGERVTYRLEGRRLVRVQTPLGGRPEVLPLVEGVKALRFRYLGEGRWLSRWSRREVPEAIRFELQLADGTWHSAFRL